MKAGWCGSGGRIGWEPTDLGEKFFHLHTLEIADFDGDGNLDLLVGEMGQGKNETPREIIFRGLDKRIIEPEVIAHLPTHGAKAGDITGDGMPDIAGKPYNSGKDQIDLLINRG